MVATLAGGKKYVVIRPFTIFWTVNCAQSVTLVQVGVSEESVDFGYAKEVTIQSSTVFQLKIEKYDGNFVYASFTVNVK